MVATSWYFHADGRLGREVPSAATPPVTYRYDPADPTPAFGGIGLMTGGVVDNGALEARADVVVHTSAALVEPLERDDAGVFSVHVTMWPAGHRFDVGHRLRVQVSSGAHSVCGRNLGSGEPHPTATAMVAADQTVHRGGTRPSRVVLPHHSSC